MSNIAVIGDRDTTLCFKAIGVDVFVAHNREEACSALADILKKRYSIIFLTEDLSPHLTEELKTLQFQTLPSVVLIPGMQGSTGLAFENIREAVKKAVGSDLLGKR